MCQQLLPPQFTEHVSICPQTWDRYSVEIPFSTHRCNDPLSKHTNRLRHVQLQCQQRSEAHIWTTAVLLYSLSVFYLKGNEGDWRGWGSGEASTLNIAVSASACMLHTEMLAPWSPKSEVSRHSGLLGTNHLNCPELPFLGNSFCARSFEYMFSPLEKL